MIEIRDLVKTFGARMVLRGISLHIEAGEFVGLLGPNGAGKTTLMNIIATLSRPDVGSIHIGGLDLTRSGAHIRRYLGYVSHKPLLYEDLTAWQNLQFYARMYDVESAPTRLEEVLTQVGLWPRRHDPVRTFSRGMQQRLALARAILHDPPVLLLDEPDTGLDQEANDLLRRLLESIEVSRRTVLMTTHNLERSVALSNRVLILANGKIRHDLSQSSLSPDAVRAAYRQG